MKKRQNNVVCFSTHILPLSQKHNDQVFDTVVSVGDIPSVISLHCWVGSSRSFLEARDLSKKVLSSRRYNLIILIRCIFCISVFFQFTLVSEPVNGYFRVFLMCILLYVYVYIIHMNIFINFFFFSD